MANSKTTERRDHSPRYQARLVFAASPAVFLLDLDLGRLVKELLVPLHTGGTIFLDGRERQASDLFSIKIIQTSQEIRPRLKTWHQEQSTRSARPVDAFLRETQLFDLEDDVTTKLIGQFRESMEWQRVLRLLEQERELRRQRAAESADGREVEDTARRLQEVADQLAYWAGLFMSGYTKY